MYKKDQIYPTLVNGMWVSSPLTHLSVYVNQAQRYGETHVAVPVDLLIRASRFKECGARKSFDSDEDGPMAPFEATCRREQDHDKPGNLEHVRKHYNGYYSWLDDVKENA